MPTITAKNDTFIKLKPYASTELKDNQKIHIAKGQKIAIYSSVADRLQHNYVKLASSLMTVDRTATTDFGYIYQPHWDNLPVDEIKLNVQYRRQNDNSNRYHGEGFRQCNLTSNAMLIGACIGDQKFNDLAKLHGFNQAEDYYGKILDKYGDTTDHDANTKALKEFGIESYFSYSLSAADLIRSLKAGIPVVIGVAYKISGHIITLVGHNFGKNIWYVHDPYGIRLGISDSYDTALTGAYDQLSQAFMDAKYWDRGGSAGWGRIVTYVEGMKTGLPGGL